MSRGVSVYTLLNPAVLILFLLGNFSSKKRDSSESDRAVVTPVAMPVVDPQEAILRIAIEANLLVSRIICYSSTACEVIEKRNEFFSVMTEERIAAYSKEPFETHKRKVLEGRRESQSMRDDRLRQVGDSMSVEEDSEIAYVVGHAHKALNCSGQAKMAYFFLMQQGINARQLVVSGIDHFYLGLQEKKEGPVFAIFDPWAGQVFLLHSERAARLSSNAYHFFNDEGRTKAVTGNRREKNIGIVFDYDSISLTPFCVSS